MSRTTKIGLWLIPWFPALVLGVLVLGFFYPWYDAYAKMGVNPDGSTWIIHGPPVPLPLAYHFGLLQVITLVCVVASVAGCALVLVAAVRKLRVKATLRA